jgi:hypothetical protein
MVYPCSMRNWAQIDVYFIEDLSHGSKSQVHGGAWALHVVRAVG